MTEQEKSKIIKTALSGHMRFEHYPKQKLYIVSFIGKKETFWVEFSRLKEAIDEFSEYLEIINKPKVAVFTSYKKKDEKQNNVSENILRVARRPSGYGKKLHGSGDIAESKKSSE